MFSFLTISFVSENWNKWQNRAKFEVSEPHKKTYSQLTSNQLMANIAKMWRKTQEVTVKNLSILKLDQKKKTKKKKNKIKMKPKTWPIHTKTYPKKKTIGVIFSPIFTEDKHKM